MLGVWKYVVVVATIIAAILTPSTDPITHLLIARAVLLLYIAGIFILKIIGR